MYHQVGIQLKNCYLIYQQKVIILMTIINSSNNLFLLIMKTFRKILASKINSLKTMLFATLIF